MFVYVCMCVCLYVRATCGDQRTTRSWLPPSTMWVLGLKLRWSASVVITSLSETWCQPSLMFCFVLFVIEFLYLTFTT